MNNNRSISVGQYHEDNPLRLKMSDAYRMDETQAVMQLMEAAQLTDAQQTKIQAQAKTLIEAVREGRKDCSGMEAFMQEYDLSTKEGIALMCVAEALGRIPDADTANALLSDKLSNIDWETAGKKSSLFVNAASWSLALTGKVLEGNENTEKSLAGTFKRLVSKTGSGVIRSAVGSAMKKVGAQFVMGNTIEEALKRAIPCEADGFSYSYDMLGEAAYTAKDAERYFKAYEEAIHAIGKSAKGKGIIAGPGISIKLSALHPRYEVSQRERVMDELSARVLSLAQLAKQYDIGLTVDAEEANRLMLSFDIIEKVFLDESLKGWNGFGLALQAYQKRAYFAIDWLAELAKRAGRPLMVRLVKGAYWDSEIKWGQLDGLSGYPVFTRKSATDVAYIASAKKLIAYGKDVFYPMFATHNAFTLSAILELAGDDLPYEFQCLHGMGESLYGGIVKNDKVKRPCRIYAPVGSHEDLLPYLVRRLLENGANSSFINRIGHEEISVESLVQSPMDIMAGVSEVPNPQIRHPEKLFGDERENSKGFDLSEYTALDGLKQSLSPWMDKQWEVAPLLGFSGGKGETKDVYSPADKSVIGEVQPVSEDEVRKAIEVGDKAAKTWRHTSLDDRADKLNKAGDLLEANKIKLVSILVREAGKTYKDAFSEIREAIDFCRYYAFQAKTYLVRKILVGPTGEENSLGYEGRGLMGCISPWNFPLAIFLGQITACLAAGNTVIAKPAEPTPIIAYEAIKLLHEAGFPKEVIQLLPGSGRMIGTILAKDERVQGVVFTGSTVTAQTINRNLAARNGAIVPLIAETGGQNAMIVDSSALAEQVVVDVIQSAFQSCGQRCSALRVLYLQDDIADKFITMLSGAMAELVVGDTRWLRTDVGPAINDGALKGLEAHEAWLQKNAKLIAKVPLPGHLNGYFFAPCAYEIDSISQLKEEVFGPVLHVVRYKQEHLDTVIHEINGTGFGLTFGVHSRVSHRTDALCSQIHAGNCYVNRNTIGAVVGVQPFGGQGLSGTGPKAGGPHYLFRLCHEKSISINTTAAGGNASLLSLEGDA